MKALVTGGGGFLGSELCRQLRARGDEVRSYSRSAHAHLQEFGVLCIQGDLRNAQALQDAMADCDTVFHVAAKAGIWGRARDYHNTNVIGTKNVIAGCRAAGVKRLIHTSSPSVCFDGQDHLDADNQLPHASRFLAPYPQSKARAELLALDANDADLSTCALRPHLIFGPGDPHLLPRLVEAARAKKLPIIGDGSNQVTLCFVENAAAAHVCAADRLEPGAPHCGLAYFIGQEESALLWGWLQEVLAGVDVAPIEKRVSRRTAYALGAVLEVLWHALPLPGEPRMTRFVATQLASSHTYSMEPARRDFGYCEGVSLEESTRRTIVWLRDSIAGQKPSGSTLRS